MRPTFAWPRPNKHLNLNLSRVFRTVRREFNWFLATIETTSDTWIHHYSSYVDWARWINSHEKDHSVDWKVDDIFFFFLKARIFFRIDYHLAVQRSNHVPTYNAGVELSYIIWSLEKFPVMATIITRHPCLSNDIAQQEFTKLEIRIQHIL